MEDRAAVVCKDLRKTYRSNGTSTVALRGIDLEIFPGELLMLVGPSGCGKTTLISIIAGILGYDEGSCSVLDHDLRSLRERERTEFRSQSIGFVFQAFNLIPTLSAAENVAIPLLINGLRRADALERARALLDRVGLESKHAASPGELSGGQQQRVAIARSLIIDPRLIVCDEPTSALDEVTGRRVMELLRELAATNNRVLVVVTHDARIFRYADRIAKMNDGRITEIVSGDAAAVH